MSNLLPKQDKFSTVVNHKSTYDYLAQKMVDREPVIFAWTDEQGTQLDILMVYQPDQRGNLQRGMSTYKDLFVAVSGHGMFGFALNGSWKSPGYVGQKLGLGDHNDTTAELSELINGVAQRMKVEV